MWIFHILFQISQGQYIFYSQHPERGCTKFFTMLTAFIARTPLFCPGYCLSRDPLTYASRQVACPPTTLCWVFDNRGKDFNFLENIPAWRVYCEYKTQERIHRRMADRRLLAIPASWGRISALNPNWDRLWWDYAPPFGLAAHCTGHCTTCAAQDIKGPCWFGVILAFLPIISGSPVWHLKHTARVAFVTRINGTSPMFQLRNC